MNKIGWALIVILVVTQLAFALELMELVSVVKRTASIDEKTAIIKNEAAMNRLESEKQRRIYYETLVNMGLFDSSFIDENEVHDIVRQGAK